MLETRFTKLTHIRYPIIQAGMAGGATTVELVTAVSNAGGLGTLGAGYLTPDKLRAEIRSIKQRTERPFGVNLFVPQDPAVSEPKIRAMTQRLDEIRSDLGIARGPSVDKYAESFEEQMEVVLEEGVPVFSFTFGIAPHSVILRLHNQGTVVMGTATTVREAMALEQAGVDAIVVQGSEAGGHRGTFLSNASQSLIGTMALVPQVADRVSLPVIASGGIMDGRGLTASLALGASAVQMGTAFLACAESGVHLRYKERLLESEEDATEITCAYSGKAARGIRTEFMERMKKYDVEQIPDYPIQNAMTQDIRRAAAKQNNAEYMSLWAGQGLRLTTSDSAQDIVQRTVEQAIAAVQSLSLN
ncbi:nitronate monooxygenase family protein [Alicyclobacillus tolerans]|uniref:NAD(P)H-dependent flavin oxidoreductase n=1 Tax=Alicyclobacillus tolerans TaxID=90970 RepID=UPI001F45696B|nr:nitronate monooxygenase family protein [Alicyclobacillus tolerans]MCF8564122.1 nitronate monooxygenase family protein [Alicyclobacillus tolerans]